jgi:hypothetical protein
MSDAAVLDLAPAEEQAKNEETTALAVVSQAEALTVTTHEEATAAVAFRSEISTRYRQAEDKRKFLKEPYLEGGRRIDAFFKPVLDALDRAKRAAGDKLLVYQAEQYRIRREAEAEAKRLADAEEKRLRDLAAKREAEEKVAREAAENAEAEGSAAYAAELHAVADAKAAKAAEFLYRAFTVPVTVAPPAQKLAGFAPRDNWGAELVSLPDVVKAAAGGNKLAVSFLAFDQPTANRAARALKSALDCPGVRSVNRPVGMGR